MKKALKPFQISKEYFRGKWQTVAFYKDKSGKIIIRPVKKDEKF